MVRTNNLATTQLAAEANLRIGISLAEPLRNTEQETVTAMAFLEKARCNGSKLVAGAACYQLGLLHERRAEAAASRVVIGDTSGPVAPEVEWAEAMRSADACFRDALRQDVKGADAEIRRLHQIEPGQSRPFYPGDAVRIHGLVSKLGRRLNRRDGVAVSYVQTSGRYGVAIDGFGIKYLRSTNLTLLDLNIDCAGPCLRGGCACDNGVTQSDAC